VVWGEDEDLDHQSGACLVQIDGERHVVCLRAVSSAPPYQPRGREATGQRGRLGLQSIVCSPLSALYHQPLDDVALVLAFRSVLSDLKIQLELLEAPVVGLRDIDKEKVVERVEEGMRLT
jgi:hypothetical protein